MRFFISKYLLVVNILLLGFFLRAQEAIIGNYLFLLDQGRDMMDVKEIVFDHHLTLIGPATSLGGVFQGPLYYYLLAIPTFIFNGNPLGAMILMLLISMSVLVVVFIYMKKFFGLPIALFSLYLFAISPEAIAAATYIWNPHPMWLLIVIFIFVLYKTILGNTKLHIFLWPLILLCFHFQTAGGVFLLIATIILFLLFHRNLLLNRHFAYGIGLAILTVFPQIIFDLRHDFLMSKSVLKIFQGSDQGLFVGNENTGYINLLLSHIQSFLNNFNSGFIQEGDFRILPKIILFFTGISALLFYKFNIFSQNEKKYVSTSLAIVFIIIAFSFVYPFPIRYWFLTGFQSFYLLVFSIILAKFWKNNIGRYVVLVFVVVTLMYSLTRINSLYFLPRDYDAAAKIQGKIAAVDFIYHDAGSSAFGVLIFNPPVITDAFDYLVWWRGNTKYQYYPHKDKKGLVYLLIEPDPARPWSYKGWLETVIITGKVLETKTLPSGLIVQKRFFE